MMQKEELTASQVSDTHSVINQVSSLHNYNLFEQDVVLSEVLRHQHSDWALQPLTQFGALVGSEEHIRLGYLANENKPILKTHSPQGERIDEVEFHPAWHELMRRAVHWKLHSLPWTEPKQSPHLVRAMYMYMDCQIEAGHGCPISMTYSVVPALRAQPDLAKEWLPKILSDQYDERLIPSAEKRGAIFGMGMTEKQGGSDVRANTTRAVSVRQSGPEKEYLITGHKWFCSAPMSDAFLILAQAEKGLSCFLVPRWLPDGTRNRIFIQRLKDKLGNHSNASSEVEFSNAHGWLLGEEGQGTRVILEMVNHTRLDCAIMSAAIMRQALTQAIHHIRQRTAFGKKLIDHPLMQRVAADLCLESEAATAMSMRLASAYDAAEAEQKAFRRIATALSKYWLGKRTPGHVAEALECLGGNGYVEESLLPRLYREAPLASIWEGSGNVICLDILRAMRKEPASLEALLQEIFSARGANQVFDRFVRSIHSTTINNTDEANARALAGQLALALQASLLLRFSPSFVAEAFCESRLDNFGSAPDVYGARVLNEPLRFIDRAVPN